MEHGKIIQHYPITDLLAVAVVACVALATAWIGYQGWPLDDAHYLQAAEAWAANGLYIGQTHWELRHGFVLPLALSVYSFGPGESALILVSLLFYFALLALTYGFVTHVFGRPEALLTTLLSATVPLLAAWATTPRAAIAEGFYLALSFWCFVYFARTSKASRPLLILSGLALGFAWLTRETALGLTFAYVLFFTVGRPIPRANYIWLIAGFAFIIAADLAFFYSSTGNPFYRLTLDLNHGVITQAASKGEAVLKVVEEAKTGSVVSGIKAVVATLVGYFNCDKITGQTPVTMFHVNAWIDPYIQFLTEPYYGLIFWLGLSVALVMASYHKGERRARAFSVLVLATVGISIVVSLYLLFLRPLPRYFLFITYLLTIILGLALAQQWRYGRKSLAVMLLLGIVTVHFVLMEARCGLGLYNERQLVEFVKTVDETVYTDPATFAMAESLLQWQGLKARVQAAVPLPGALYFFNGERSLGSSHRAWLNDVNVNDWEAVFLHTGRKKWLGVLMEVTGIAQYLSIYAYQRLALPYGQVKVLRAPESFNAYSESTMHQKP